MFAFMRRHLVVKVGLVLILTTALGFLVYGWSSIREAQETLDEQHRQTASGIAGAITAGVRSSMLQGNGGAVRDIVADTLAHVPWADVRVYAPSGERVFEPPPPPPDLASLPPLLRAALAGSADGQREDGARLHPIANEERCRRCHTEGSHRGVLTLKTAGAQKPLDDGEHGMEVLSALVRSGFVQIMTAGHEQGLGDYFDELVSQAPAIRGVAVYGQDGAPHFGDLPDAPPEADLNRALAGDLVTIEAGERRTHVLPLANEERCHGCHGAYPAVRGALAISFDRKLGSDETLSQVTDVSLRHIMLSGLGRLVKRYLDDEAATGAVAELTLHDADGRLYHDAFARPRPPDYIVEALRTLKTHDGVETEANGKRYVYVEPLRNEAKCFRCHGADREVRGAVEVTLDTSADLMASRAALGQHLAGYGLVTVGLVLTGLTVALRRAVLRPLREIGNVAEQVARDDLSVMAPVHSTDEIGRLAQRINEMVAGLRQRRALTKFVSGGALRAVEGPGGQGELKGTRCRLTVLFSDLRGFTAYSEKLAPEQVVWMLNEYLHAQTDVVRKHGGDIDKFVGDELMALFGGEGAERRAVLAALDMVAAVEGLNKRHHAGNQMAIGVGVNAGDMIHGPMGHADRMDFTVIGDAVNLGARLCKAAERGQVLVSAPTVKAAGDVEGVIWRRLEPIAVKGKSAVVEVLAAERADGGAG